MQSLFNIANYQLTSSVAFEREHIGLRGSLVLNLVALPEAEVAAEELAGRVGGQQRELVGPLGDHRHADPGRDLICHSCCGVVSVGDKTLTGQRAMCGQIPRS